MRIHSKLAGGIFGLFFLVFGNNEHGGEPGQGSDSSMTEPSSTSSGNSSANSENTVPDFVFCSRRLPL